jgi:hypothetical protein
MERNLFLAELSRVRNFAMLSKNLDDTVRELEQTLDYYQLSLF